MAAVYYIQLTRSDVSIPSEHIDALSSRVRGGDETAGFQAQQLADTEPWSPQGGLNLKREVQQPC
jgi:hypothetical protein